MIARAPSRARRLAAGAAFVLACVAATAIGYVLLWFALAIAVVFES